MRNKYARTEFVIYVYDIYYKENGRTKRHWYPFRFVINGEEYRRNEFELKMNEIAVRQILTNSNSRSIAYKTFNINLDNR